MWEEVLKGKWQQDLQDVEQRRNDLLSEHQKMQNRSQKTAESTGQKEAVSEERGQVG